MYKYANNLTINLINDIVAGEIIEKLGDVFEDGWCRGRKDGREGLYPSNFVESVLMNEVTLNNLTISHSHV